MDDQASIELMLRRQHVMPTWTSLYHPAAPLEIVSGNGRHLYDRLGREYLDFYSGIAANSLGYDVPEVRDRVLERIRTGIVHTSTFYLDRSRVELAERIARLSGIPDSVVFFTCSGSEAVETALLLATEYRRSRQVIALRHSYHGRSFGALSTTGDNRWHGLGASPLNVTHVRAGQPEEGVVSDLDHASYLRLCSEELEELVDEVLPQPVAAMLAEPVQGIAGAVPLEPRQLASYAEILDGRGIPLIVDEVQTGWGRTGRFWGYEWDEVCPDMLVFAKGVANGFALGGVVGRREIMSCLPMPSISTFGGNQLAVSAGIATLEVIERRNLADRAYRAGELLRNRLERGAGLSCVDRLRGRGLLLGLTCVLPGTTVPSSEFATAVQDACRENGLLIGLGGLRGNCLRIMPPLTVSDEELRQGADILVDALDSVQASWRRE
ncbi:aspartate aminotransferase family protein [Actinopolyspora erythraea]|uniref:Aspartate aminotransferase family protein n=1 Tax=Actinopolyspora erythraea TaxID=414996 RepID=A0A099D5X5_9ACTN|nr:aminotransferase class III-fold pyridoxal phosphate-dependent enzyme [Actinopolyspora erythraea]ASU78758.1 aspartate aminotransferase family protein [Actinopolyspora erythraea]KGI81513.1 hypothetical protein IL38_11310 [Actinopolyspora erythraea]